MSPFNLRQAVQAWLDLLKPEYKEWLNGSSLAEEAFSNYEKVFPLDFCDDCDTFRKHWKQNYLNLVSYTVWNAVVAYEVGVLKRNTRKDSGHTTADKLQQEFLRKFV
jgi:hypothetical protein